METCSEPRSWGYGHWPGTWPGVSDIICLYFSFLMRWLEGIISMILTIAKCYDFPVRVVIVKHCSVLSWMFGLTKSYIEALNA